MTWMFSPYQWTGAHGCCPRNWTANPVLFPCSSLAVGETGWSCGPEQLRSFNLDARKCFPATFTRTLPPLPARLSSQTLSRLLLRSSRIKTVMFGRSKKRRDDAGGEVGRCPKVWRLHGARREAFELQRRAFYCFKNFFFFFLCNLISLSRDLSSGW